VNAGDTVQIRQSDGGVDYWIFAKVIDPNTRQVQVTHPGNREDAAVKVMAAPDIRTKTDVQALLTTAQSIATAGTRVTDAQLNTLAAADGFFNRFKKPDGLPTQAARESLQKVIVSHYQSQVNQLS
jgi:hypothetical protein